MKHAGVHAYALFTNINDRHPVHAQCADVSQTILQGNPCRSILLRCVYMYIQHFKAHTCKCASIVFLQPGSDIPKQGINILVGVAFHQETQLNLNKEIRFDQTTSKYEIHVHCYSSRRYTIRFDQTTF